MKITFYSNKKYFIKKNNIYFINTIIELIKLSLIKLLANAVNTLFFMQLYY